MDIHDASSQALGRLSVSLATSPCYIPKGALAKTSEVLFEHRISMIRQPRSMSICTGAYPGYELLLIHANYPAHHEASIR
jgi:hypothetical protein